MSSGVRAQRPVGSFCRLSSLSLAYGPGQPDYEHSPAPPGGLDLPGACRSDKNDLRVRDYSKMYILAGKFRITALL
ncbi:hypothetical protein GCM10017781_20590 [Deinococcus metalli]|uniref:Uncharacterized protein n=1 Tax=Deinococcus metalli TaxID=1141878 RepID=A0ABQ3JN36_9DEIO|nr:hypothetical protein GCM10017781_20590 [Deinococcus metalli]